jgi:MoaA/NifB/PqqE/SkfB family radical SAM enzyme
MKNVIKLQVGNFITNRVIDYLRKDPFVRFEKMIRFATLLDIKKKHGRMLETALRKATDRESRWSGYYLSFLNELDKKVFKKFLNNLVLKSILTNSDRLRNRVKLGFPVPWAILMDPTSACNLKCTGCWAAEYEKTTSMDFELLDRIIKEAKDLGTFFFLFSGGEPLLRKKDIIRLCEKHQDCFFSCFTNGTLIDNDLAREIRRVGNFAPALSIEGFEDETDFRRGQGTYREVIEAMNILRDNGILFGCSTCYHRKNTERLASKEFIEFMIQMGCRFAWYFTYMPVGSKALPDLIATADQRKFMYHTLRELRKEKPLFIVDFWNDGEFSGGCIAGGRRFLHINSNGDVEPCAFIHFSGANIKDMSLKEALSQPLFMEYQKRQPFNNNFLQPCPCLDNPQQLREMVNISKAKSTHPYGPESVEALTAKCEDASKAWAIVSEELRQEKLNGIPIAEKV